MPLRLSLPRLLLCLWSLSAWSSAHAQTDSTRAFPTRRSIHHDELTLLTGYHQGRFGFAEVGLGRNRYGVVHHPYDFGYYLGAEARVDRPQLWGAKVGVYVDGGVAMGLQLIHYFNGTQGGTVLRPEFGIGVWKAKMTYAYNISLAGHPLPAINTHQLSLSYALRLLRLPRDDEHRSKRRP
jgi:hypothetical protein